MVGGGSGGKRAICDRVQLLLLAKACNHFLMCAVLSLLLSLSLSKSITFSKEGREWKVGGTVMCLGVHSQQMPWGVSCADRETMCTLFECTGLILADRL